MKKILLFSFLVSSIFSMQANDTVSSRTLFKNAAYYLTTSFISANIFTRPFHDHRSDGNILTMALTGCLNVSLAREIITDSKNSSQLLTAVRGLAYALGTYHGSLK